jgi:hypothetical protein
MSPILRGAAALATLCLLGACAPKAEPVSYVDQPVMGEPTYGGKYN